MKNNLNQEFYKWIDDVRRAFRKKEELEIELKEYERRLNGYNAVSYDLIGSKGEGVDAVSKVLNHLSKINDIENRINSNNAKLYEYNKFKEIIIFRYAMILDNIVVDMYSIRLIAENYGVSKHRIYTAYNKIKQKFREKNEQ